MDKKKFRKILEEKVQNLLSENEDQKLIDKVIKRLCLSFVGRLGNNEKIKKSEINKKLKSLLKEEKDAKI